MVYSTIRRAGDARRTTIARVDSGVRRRGIVYGFRAVHPITGVIIPVAYVGQSRQRLHLPNAPWEAALKARGAQHREDQPWADTIVGEPYIIAAGMFTDDELTACEFEHIARLQPTYNIKGNETNPHRIPPWTALEQRWARDDAAGLPRWVPPKERPDGYATPGRLDVRWSPPGRVAVWLRRVPRRVVGAVSWWVLLVTALWWALAAGMDAPNAAGGATVGASLIVGGAVWPRKRRRRSRVRR